MCKDQSITFLQEGVPLAERRAAGSKAALVLAGAAQGRKDQSALSQEAFQGVESTYEKENHDALPEPRNRALCQQSDLAALAGAWRLPFLPGSDTAGKTPEAQTASAPASVANAGRDRTGDRT